MTKEQQELLTRIGNLQKKPGLTIREENTLIEAAILIEQQAKEVEQANNLAKSMSKLHDDECAENQELNDKIEKLVQTLEWALPLVQARRADDVRNLDIAKDFLSYIKKEKAR